MTTQNEPAMSGFLGSLMAEEYLGHKYEEASGIQFPMPDESFVRSWREWLTDKAKFPGDIRDMMIGGGTRVWIEETPAGGVPVVYAPDRENFERLVALLSAQDERRLLPASVNAFTVPAKHAEFRGHRVICLARAGYSALSCADVGFTNDEWLEKSLTIRLNHECCHYFTLRALGGMKNHALDEIVADCVGQLAAFGCFSADMQRHFFGISKGVLSPEGRLSFYVRTLPPGAVTRVCSEVDKALDSLERYLSENPNEGSETARPSLIMRLASAGIKGIGDL